MRRLFVAVIFGGCSAEYGVSLESAYAVIKNMNREKFQPLPVGITEKGEWFLFNGDIHKIKDNTWLNETDCVPVLYSPDRQEHRLILFHGDKTETLDIDVVFPVLHGRNGEDGTVQGLVELSGTPLVGCGTLASALCMDKDRAHRLAGCAGVKVPNAMVLDGMDDTGKAAAFAEMVGYPVFVKPVRSGSSYGITKATQAGELESAVKTAFEYDSHVIIEQAIEGFEVGCAVMGNDSLTVGEVDEIELCGDFFNFTEKYTLKTSSIHVPARVSPEKRGEIKQTAQKIYRALGCSGFARVDMFLTPQGDIVFNEVNTIPGFTEHSRFPNMMKAAGVSFEQVISRVIELAVAQ